MKAPQDHQEGASALPQQAPGSAPAPNTDVSAQDTIPPASAALPEALNEDERPTPPRIPRIRKRSGSFSRRQSSAPLTPPAPAPLAPPPAEPAPPSPPAEPVPPAPTPAAPEPGLADLEWMPQPAEDPVARFLSDVAEIEPPQPRERDASAPPAFLPPLSSSPEEAERKKARAEPFLSQIHAAPMAPVRKVRAQKRWRRLLIWLTVIAALLLVAIIAMKVALPHLHL